LARANGHRVDRLEIVYIFRDWTRTAADRDHEYPQRQVLVYFIPMWPEQKTRAFLEEKVAEHKAARNGYVRNCTDEERWADPPKWAVKKKTNKTAYRLLSSEEEARA